MIIIGTGLSGLVGSRIVELLQKKHLFTDFSLDSGVDITDFNQLKKAFQENQEAEIVLHLAAFTDVDTAYQQKDDKNGLCYRVNVLGTKNIARLCKETGKYLIHISTDFVFSGRKKTAYTEDDTPDPIEWYGQTKYWAEEEVKNSGSDNTILRIAFPYKAEAGPKQLEPRVKLDLVRKIKQKLEKEEKIPAFTDQIITPTFIDDIAGGVRVVAERKPKGIYHLVGSNSLSPFELAQKIADTFRLSKKLIEKESLKGYLVQNKRPRQIRMELSNKKIYEKLGIKMKTVDQALQLIKEQLTD